MKKNRHSQPTKSLWSHQNHSPLANLFPNSKLTTHDSPLKLLNSFSSFNHSLNLSKNLGCYIVSVLSLQGVDKTSFLSSLQFLNLPKNPNQPKGINMYSSNNGILFLDPEQIHLNADNSLDNQNTQLILFLLSVSHSIIILMDQDEDKNMILLNHLKKIDNLKTTLFNNTNQPQQKPSKSVKIVNKSNSGLNPIIPHLFFTLNNCDQSILNFHSMKSKVDQFKQVLQQSKVYVSGLNVSKIYNFSLDPIQLSSHKQTFSQPTLGKKSTVTETDEDKSESKIIDKKANSKLVNVVVKGIISQTNSKDDITLSKKPLHVQDLQDHVNQGIHSQINLKVNKGNTKGPSETQNPKALKPKDDLGLNQRCSNYITILGDFNIIFLPKQFNQKLSLGEIWGYPYRYETMIQRMGDIVQGVPRTTSVGFRSGFGMSEHEWHLFAAQVWNMIQIQLKSV
ncbi:hypothetical protein BC833DRAFT_610906 [Globomyces pollinis-pini]|nr:hypothetical protein BC833DRAFT_610906 [Globomyces pollinis-pini]